MKNLGKKTSIQGRNRLRSGTTLVEVILAAVLIGILAIVAVTALMYPTQLVVSDARRQVALHEANAEMERVTAESYSDITDANFPDRTVDTLYKTLTISTEIIPLPDEKEITVTTIDEDGTTNIWLKTLRPDPNG